MTSIVIIVGVLVVTLFAMFVVYRVYPIDILAKDVEVNIYLDGKYNRTATITDVRRAFLTVYERLPLPIDYRGKFYATGRMSDGHTLMFLRRKKLYFLMRFAELIRKLVHTPEYQEQLLETQESTEPMEEAEDEL